VSFRAAGKDVAEAMPGVGPGDYALRMTSMTTTMSKIRKSRPPPIYMTPPWMIPCTRMRSYLYASVWTRRITHHVKPQLRDAGLQLMRAPVLTALSECDGRQ
jgi:hypothetical protein